MADKIFSTLRQFEMSLQMRVNDVRRAFREFLAFPTVIILLFFLLSIGAYLFERSQIKITSPIYGFFESHIFVDAESTSNLLGNIAGSIITVTSITITLLLLIVQQSASNMTTQVFDQFLRRRSNQFYFGYFVGVAVFSLITLATVDEPFNPVFSASLVFLLTVVALFLLILLFYMTIRQMRPPVILGAIHDHALSAREYQRSLLRRTHRQPQSTAQVSLSVYSQQHGFVTEINLDALNGILKDYSMIQEIKLVVSIGSFVAYQDVIAEIKMTEEPDQQEDGLPDRVRGAFDLERSRDIETDPDYGVTQLEQIAWAVLSPSKSNLASGLQGIFLLRNLLSRWAEDEEPSSEDEVLPIVYNDNVLGGLIQAFESLSVVAALSREHQAVSVILDALAGVYGRMPGKWKTEIENTVLRILPTLEEHRLTTRLEAALVKTASVFRDSGRHQTAKRIQGLLAARLAALE